jgi:transposase
LTIARNSAVKATITAINKIKALLVGTDQDLRHQLRVRSLLQLAILCSQLPPASGLHAALASLGRRWLQLHQEIAELNRLIRDLVRRTVPKLIERPGIGIHSAAQLLITVGGNSERLHSDAAFAALCGASPVQASSGQRHRLNRGGDRAANALWTIANDRMIHDPPNPRIRRATTPTWRQPQGHPPGLQALDRPRDLRDHPGPAPVRTGPRERCLT